MFIKSIFNGILKAIPIVGNIKSEFKANKESKAGGEGKIDKSRMVAYFLIAGVVLARLIFPDVISWKNITELIGLIL